MGSNKMNQGRLSYIQLCLSHTKLFWGGVLVKRARLKAIKMPTPWVSLALAFQTASKEVG